MGALSRWWVCVGVVVFSGCPKVEPVPPVPVPPLPASVQAELGPEGGTLVGPDGVELLVPAGALAARVTLAITRSDVGAPARPDGADAVFELTPHGQQFAVPVTLRAPARFDAPVVFMAERDAGWALLQPTLVDGKAQWEVTHFSWFYVSPGCVAPPDDPDACGLPTCTVEAEATPAEALAVLVPPSLTPNSQAEARLRDDGTAQLKVHYGAPPGSSACVLQLFEMDGVNARFKSTTSPPTEEGFWSWTPVVDRTRPVVFLATFECTRKGIRRQGRNLLRLQFGETHWQLGGVASGLTASGLVLTNGSEDLPVPANGAFTFATQVLHATPYSVSVKATPPGHTCTVVGGAGVATANVTTVAVTCMRGPWGGAQQLAAGAENPTLAMDPSGNALAVWLQRGAGGTDVWGSRFTLAGGWQPAQLLETDPGTAGAPHVALDATGDGFAAWSQVVGTTAVTRAARFTLAGGWQAPQDVESAPGESRAPYVSCASNGDGWLVWSQVDASSSRVRAARFSGGAWGAPTSIDGDQGATTSPRVVTLSNGITLAAWVQAVGAEDFIFFNVFNGFGWSTADFLDGENTHSLTQPPELAADAAGTAMVVWSRGDGVGQSVFARRLVRGTWEAVEAVEGHAAALAVEPRVVLEPSGEATVVWREVIAGSSRLWSRRFSPTTGWGVEVEVSAPLGAGAGQPALARHVGGQAMVLWPHAVTAASATPWVSLGGASWAAPLELGGGAATQAALATDAAGHALALWVDGAELWTNALLR